MPRLCGLVAENFSELEEEEHRALFTPLGCVRFVALRAVSSPICALSGPVFVSGPA